MNADATALVAAAPAGLLFPTTTLHVDDTAGDATSPATEVTFFEAHMNADATALVVVVQVDTLYPSPAALTPVSYSVVVNGDQFDSFGRYPIDAAPLTWDGKAGAYAPAGTSSWDTGANQATLTLPLDSLEETAGIAYPFQLHAQANFGGLAKTQPDDLCPDEGDVPF